MPWQRPETWDTATRDAYQALIALRRPSQALQRGGLRFVDIGPDAIAFLRETASERLLCLASRRPHEAIAVSLADLGASQLETLFGDDPIMTSDEALLPADGPSFHAWKLARQ